MPCRAIQTLPNRSRPGSTTCRRQPGPPSGGSIRIMPMPSGAGRKWGRRTISTPQMSRSSTTYRGASRSRSRSTLSMACSASTLPCRRLPWRRSPCSLRQAAVTDAASQSDEALLDRFQRAAFGYFVDHVKPENGLVADASRAGAPASIAVVGFALSCYPVAVERRWMTRSDAAARTLVTLRFFCGSPQGDEPDATGYKGFYYHFIDMTTGRRAWQSELSLIDTTLLLAGVLTASVYFDEDTASESEIRARADAIYRRMDWQWARDGGTTERQGWKPESGFLHYGWEGYSEAIILYVLGLASPSFPVPDDSFGAWTATYQWENIYDREFLYAGPLFIHLFSHAWIDFAGIRDRFMREKDSDYF